MPSPVTRKAPNRRSRELSGLERPQLFQMPIGIVSAEASGSVLTVEFDQAVSLDGVPQYTTDVEGATPVSATQPNPISVQITFSASVAAATEIVIPSQDPAVRNVPGGYVSPRTFQL